MAVAACIATVTLAAPARAETVSGSCDSGLGHRLQGNAHFTVGNGGWRNWYLFAGKVGGPGLGNKNNVNMFFYQDYQQNWTRFSPDNVRPESWFYSSANINMPPWSVQQARWEGIFDISGPDPDCSAYSDLVSG
jgi:hypothetical protein